MRDLDRREWLLTNQYGGFASGTVSDARTRTYHGWLFAALDPPDRCTLLLAHIDASLEVAGQSIALSTNFWQGGAISPRGYRWLRSFTLDPLPTWTWQRQDWQLTRQIRLPAGVGPPAPKRLDIGEKLEESLGQRVLIEYHYAGQTPATLRLRPLIADRDFHQQQQQSAQHFSQLIGPQQLLLQGRRSEQVGPPWQLSWTQGHYHPEGMWYVNYHYPEETQRGLSDAEDLYSPGCLSVWLQPGDRVTVIASLADLGPTASIPADHIRLNQRLVDLLAYGAPSQPQAAAVPIPLVKLLVAGDRFLAWRVSTASPTVIAGYPWFRDQGRFMLLAIPGLALATQRFELARAMLAAMSQHCHHGLLPNGFTNGQPVYDSLDTALWWIETLGLYLEATQDWAFLKEQYATVKRMYKAVTAGTLYNIRIDAADGLICWEDPQMALTWMDARSNGRPVTPRSGKPIEINALWYSALCWATQWAQLLRQDDSTPALRNQAQRYAAQADQVKQSLQRFWQAERGYLLDVIDPEDRGDAAIRPNAVLALSLSHCAFAPDQGRAILQVARDRLLTPYGLRTLDPADPAYIGKYDGLPWQRELAAHQGTVWSWLIGPFGRAWQRFYPDQPLPWDGQPLADHFDRAVGLEAISELFDGDAPHLPRGAIANAAVIAELVRWQLPPAIA
jgi:predicted glycogen debranching enzyme